MLSSNPDEVATAEGTIGDDAAQRRGQVAEQLLDILAAGPGGHQVEMRLLARLGEALGWDVTSYWRVDTPGGSLDCQAVWRSSAGAFDRFCAVTQAVSLGHGIGLPGRVAASAQPAWIVDLADDDNFPRSPTAVDEGLRSAFAFPVATEDRLLGVIEMFSTERRQLDQDLCRVMAAVGLHLGVFLARADEAQSARSSSSSWNGPGAVASSSSAPAASWPRRLAFARPSSGWPISPFRPWATCA